MTPEKYEIFRDELIDLLTRAIDLSANEYTRGELGRICQKTREDQFDIVLAGEFQGGKSTTFNTLCDGRELSPRGSGIKTSGCLLSARNISGWDEPESATVNWKDSRELISGFSDLVLPHLKSLDPGRFAKMSAMELGSILSLEEKPDLRLLSAALDQEWMIWEKNKSGYDLEQKGLLDILRIASIIVHFYGDEKLKGYCENTLYEPENVGNMIVFPRDWEKRWLKNDPSRFAIEEILFAFIKKIHLKLHSDNLGRLGCMVTDCPGLFASRWDTEIAREAMFNADAILYLIDCSRTLKLSDLHALQFVRQNRMEDKLFYGLNIRGHSYENSKKILQTTVNSLRNQGYKVKEGEVAPFHALMALRSVQGERILTNRLDEKTIVFLASGNGKKKRETAKKKINRDLIRQLMVLDLEDPYEGIDSDSLEYTRRISGMDRLITTVENTVINKKAKTILITHGSRKGIDCLLETEGSLRHREEAALETEKVFSKEVENAEETLKKFDDTCRLVIDRLDDDTPDRLVAQDGWEFIFRRKDELFKQITRSLMDEITTIGLWDSVFKRKRLMNKIDGIIKKAIESFFENTVIAWIADIKDGRNPTFNELITGKIRSIDKELRSRWQELKPGRSGLLSGITIPNHSGNLAIDSENILKQLDKNELVGNLGLNIYARAGGIIGFLVFGLATLGTFAFITNHFVAVAAMIIITSVGGSGTIIMIEKAKQNMIINKIEKALPPFLEKFFEEMEPHLKGQLKTFIADVRNLYKQGFLSAVQSPRRVFEKRKKQAADDFLKSREERLSIAKDSRKIREEQIRPLRKSFQEFVVRVENCLAEKEADIAGKEKIMEDFSLNMDNAFDDSSLLSPFPKG